MLELPKSTDVIMVLVTTPTQQAQHIARGIMDQKLAACINIAAPSRSLYWWQGELEDDDETLLTIKTTRATYSRLEAAIRDLHPATVPEIIVIDVTSGYSPYLEWVHETVENVS